MTPVASVPQALIMPPDLPAKNRRANGSRWRAPSPGEMNFSSAGLASTSYLGAEILKQTAKINIVHIPQRGAPEAITSVMRGDSQLFFLGVHLATELHVSGKVRAMAIATPKRTPALPDVPTVAESGLPDYEYDSWFGGDGAGRHAEADPQQGERRTSRACCRRPRLPERLTRQGVEIVLQPRRTCSTRSSSPRSSATAAMLARRGRRREH